MLFHISLEAYVGVVLSLFIIKAGIELVKESIDNILGVRIESDLARKIKKDISSEKDVQGAYDLVLNDYGPDRYIGSIHIEVPDTLSVAEIDKMSRRITKKISKKYGITLHTIGIYSVNTKDKKIRTVQKEIQDIVFSHKGVLQMHGFYYGEEDKFISFDIIIDFKVKDREKLYQEIYDKIQEKFKDYEIDITLDIDISD